MMGVAVRASVPLKLQLNPLFWRQLHGCQALGLNDLTEADQQTARLIRMMRSLGTEEELEAVRELDFVADNFAGEAVRVGEPGRSVQSLEDARDLAGCIEHLLLVESVEPAVEHVAKGLGAVVPLGLLRLLLSPADLEEAVCGQTDVDLSELRRHTDFAGAEGSGGEVAPDPEAEASPLSWLFAALEAFDASTRRGFVRLVSGCRQLPREGDWRLQVRLGAPGSGALPTARACGMILTLPHGLESAEDLAERLRTAIAATDAPHED